MELRGHFSPCRQKPGSAAIQNSMMYGEEKIQSNTGKVLLILDCTAGLHYV
jgi:hypothetical protein